jgi:hypothetical protein
MDSSKIGSKGNIYGTLAWVFLGLWVLYFFGPSEGESFPLASIILIASPAAVIILSYLSIRFNKKAWNITSLILGVLQLIFIGFAFYFGKYILN